MNNTVKEAIYKALNGLIESQFEEFTWMLSSIDYEEKPNIPKAQLEKASRRKVVDLLSQHYGEDALEVCIQVLRNCNINDLVKNLEETGQKVVDAHQLPDLSDYRQYIKEKFQTMKDPNAVPGEYVSLNERYSKLRILDHHLSKQERENEILHIGRNRPESSASIETLFNPDKHGLIPQVVVLQGAAGIGKTMMSKKIMFDWASQQLYQDKFNFVFYICCRKMNLHAETEKHSIAEIISEGWLNLHESKKVIPNILKNEGKLLFVIDGFDELYSFDWSKDSFFSDPWKKEPVRILLSSLFQKKLLRKSSLIITTRPTALEKLQCLQNPGYFEILGFSPEEREEYFYNFLKNNDQAIKAFRFVKQNDTLFAMCAIPLVSWIICTVLKQEMERGQDLQKTTYILTAIYMLYLSSLFEFHHKESKQDVQSNVKGLCSLAAEGILEKKIFFMEKDVEKHIRDQGNSLPLFLNQSIFKKDTECIQTYSFIHLSFQEFFAALYYLLEEGDEQHSQNLNENLQKLLERYESFKIHFDIGFRFLFGFLSEGEKMRELKEKFGWEISPKNKEFVFEWVKNSVNNGRLSSSKKEMFCYLYETQDGNFIKNALYGFNAITLTYNSSMEFMIISYCIQYCQNLKELTLECCFPGNYLENKDLNERCMKQFFTALTKLRNLSILRCSAISRGEPFTETWNRHLVEVFKNQGMKTLYLYFSNREDRIVELLFEGLQHPDCKIEKLGLFFIRTEPCGRYLAEVLKKNQRLRELWLYEPSLCKKEMEILCDGLKHSQCKIETLQICYQDLDGFYSRHVAEVLRKNQRLRRFQLEIESSTKKEMELLCHALTDPQCTIEALHLKIDKISCSRHVAGVLRKNQRLRTLYLYISSPEEEIMERLCDGLKHPQCTIETLELCLLILTESCIRHVADVLRKNQSLRELHLIVWEGEDKATELLRNVLNQCTIETLQLDGDVVTKSFITDIGDVLKKEDQLRKVKKRFPSLDNQGVELLSGQLNDLEREIKKLKLAGEDSAIFCNRPLAEVLSKNQRLRGLTLSLRSYKDHRIELLCNELNNPGCTVKKIKLGENVLTESSSEYLAEVFKTNQRLTELELCLPRPDDKAVERLCGWLNDPECKINKLKFSGLILNESYSRHLAEVFRGNQSLRQLELTIKYPDEKTVGPLYEGLKHPKCKIETAQLNGKHIIQNGKWMDMERTA